MSELTRQRISHTAAWNVVQQLGKRLDKQEQDASTLAEAVFLSLICPLSPLKTAENRRKLREVDSAKVL